MKLHNLIVFLSSFSPAIALVINQLKIEGKRWFYVTQASLIACASLFFLTFQHWRWGPFSNLVFALYIVELSVFLTMFTHKFGHKNFSKNLALSLLLVFVLMEVHEYADFILCDYLRYFPPQIDVAPPLWQRITTNIYTIISFGLALHISNLKISKLSGVLLFGSLTFPFVAFYFRNTPFHALVDLLNRMIIFCFWLLGFYHSPINSGVR